MYKEEYVRLSVLSWLIRFLPALAAFFFHTHIYQNPASHVRIGSKSRLGERMNF